MGMTISSVFVKTNSNTKRKLLNIIGKLSNYNDPDYYGLLSINDYDVLMFNDEYKDPTKIGKTISNLLNVLTISFYTFDSDFAYIQLLDKYNSINITINKELALSYDFNEEDNNIELITNYIDDKYTLDDVYEIINKEYTFAEEGLIELLKLFNIDLNEML